MTNGSRFALNRAKREPFVIYMMSILSDVTLNRAGFDTALRDQIAAAWRKEDFTTTGSLIPDELRDALILRGTPQAVALAAQKRTAFASLRSRLGAYYEIIRPFSFTASTVPVAVAGALAAVESRFDLGLFVVALVAGVLLHIGTNVTNEIYDVRKGVD